jgi:hypothetical protein
MGDGCIVIFHNMSCLVIPRFLRRTPPMVGRNAHYREVTPQLRGHLQIEESLRDRIQ